MVSRYTEVSQRGGGMGVLQAIAALSIALGAFISGASQFYGIRYVPLVYVGFAALCCVVVFR
jgi:hypothetical protein